MGSLPKEPGNHSPFWDEVAYKQALIGYESHKNSMLGSNAMPDFPSLAKEYISELATVRYGYPETSREGASEQPDLSFGLPRMLLQRPP